MIKVTFFTRQSKAAGFRLSGHSGYSDEGSDIVCASVSSCAYMTANTVTEILGLPAEIEVDEAYMSLILEDDAATKAKDILAGFELHIKALADDYSEYIVCGYENIK